MTEIQNSKRFDLEERTLAFAKAVRLFVRELPRTASNIEDISQLIRSSGSVGANYIEAKESSYWLKLINTGDSLRLGKKRDDLVKETIELMSIFGSIVRKLE